MFHRLNPMKVRAIDPVLGKNARNLQSNPRELLAGGWRVGVHHPRAEILRFRGFLAGLDDLDLRHDAVSYDALAASCASEMSADSKLCL